MSAARPKKDSPEGAPPSFEQRLEALEKVVADLEGEELPLEASLERYRQGVEHLRACRALLDDAERRLAELVAVPGAAGETQAVEKPLRVTDKGLSPDEDDDDIPF